MNTRVQYSLGTLDIARGNYDLALKNLAMSNKDYWGVTWKKAIAHIMLGNIDDARTALISIKDFFPKLGVLNKSDSILVTKSPM